MNIKVPTGSMLPTIQLGDQILVNRLVYRFKPPKGGCCGIQIPDNPKELYKAPYRHGGDKVEIMRASFMNGQPVEEDYLYEEMRQLRPYRCRRAVISCWGQQERSRTAGSGGTNMLP